MRNARTRDYFWNTVAGIINAAESVVMLFIVTRFGTLEEAGFLTFAFAVGNLLLVIGKYGVRQFQVTDYCSEYSFSVYLKTRIITVLFMLIGLLIYTIYCIYGVEDSVSKLSTVVIVTLIYVIEVVEDLFWGHYQLRNTLYKGALLFVVRWIAIMLTFAISYLYFNNVENSLFCCLIISAIVLVIMLSNSWGKVAIDDDKYHSFDEKTDIIRMLKQCFPLFLSSFLSMYISNLPKYALDIYSTAEEQACYGFVAMPVFVIGLINSFIYTPQLTLMAEDFSKREYVALKDRIVKHMLFIALIGVLCIVGTIACGNCVLSCLFNTDLSDYFYEMVLLMVSGLFLCYLGYLIAVVTVMRVQKYIIYIYIPISIVASILVLFFVKKFGIIGAAVSYLLTILLLFVLLFLLLTKKIRSILKTDTGEFV